MQEKQQKISPIKQKILQFADYKGLSKRSFYATINVSRGTLESNTGITEDILTKFIATYPEVSLEWLLRGNGSMLAVGSSSDADAKQAIYDLTIENLRLKRRIDELEGKGAENHAV